MEWEIDKDQSESADLLQHFSRSKQGQSTLTLSEIKVDQCMKLGWLGSSLILYPFKFLPLSTLAKINISKIEVIFEQLWSPKKIEVD